MDNFEPTRRPFARPWGRCLEAPAQLCPGLWFFRAERHFGVAISHARYLAVKRMFPGFKPKNLTWWSDDGDFAVAVAAFPQAFTDRDCFWAYHKILSNAQWEKRFLRVANLCHQTEVHRRSIKYAADNKRFFVRSEILESDGDKLKMRLVRQSDGHVVTVLVHREWALENRLYSEAEVSMFLVAPDL